MAIALLDQGTKTDGNSVSSLTLSVTLTAGANFLRVVPTWQNTTSGVTITGVTYNGVALTQVTSARIQENFFSNYTGADCWYMTSPPTGAAYNLVVTFSSAAQDYGFGYDSWSGVDTSNPVGTVVTNSSGTNATSTTPSATCTISGNDVAMGACCDNAAPTTGNTNIWSYNSVANNANYAEGSYSTSTGALTWTAADNPWVAIALPVHAAPANASALTLNGPAWGQNGKQSPAFMVKGDINTFAASTTVTPSDSGAGGTFTPSTVVLSTTNPYGFFTYTPAGTGTLSISITNDQSLTNPGSASFSSVTAFTLPAGIMGKQMMVIDGWFDKTMQIAGWFDKNLLDSAPGNSGAFSTAGIASTSLVSAATAASALSSSGAASTSLVGANAAANPSSIAIGWNGYITVPMSALSINTGVLLTCKTKNWQPSGYPYQQYNKYPFQLQFSSGTNIWCVTGNMATATTDSTHSGFNQNITISALGDQLGNIWETTPEAQSIDWVYNAWQFYIDGSGGIVCRQWGRFGQTGCWVYDEVTVSQATMRTATGNGSWVAGSLDTILVGYQDEDHIDFNMTEIRMYETGTKPTQAALSAIFYSQAADTSAWCDIPGTYSAGSAVIADRSGHSRTVTPSGTIGEGLPVEIPSGIYLVQNCEYQTGGGVSSLAATFDSTPTVNNVITAEGVSSGGTPAAHDNQSNSWTMRYGTSSGNSAHPFVAHGVAATASGTFTVTVDGLSSSNASMRVIEWQGIDSSAREDWYKVNNTAASPLTITADGADSHDGTLVISSMTPTGGFSDLMVFPAGWNAIQGTTVQAAASGSTGAQARKKTATATTESIIWPAQVSTPTMAGILVGFKPATGSSPTNGTLSSSGAASTSIVGAATAAGAVSSSGVAAATLAGAIIISAAFTSPGTGAASLVGNAIDSGAMSSSGVAAVSAVGQSIPSSALSSAGVATVSAVGQSIASAALSSNGMASVAQVGNSIFSAALNAAGLTDPVFSSNSGITLSGALTSNGVAAVSPVGQSIFNAALSSSGVASVANVGISIFSGQLVSAGVATVSFNSNTSQFITAAFSTSGAATSGFLSASTNAVLGKITVGRSNVITSGRPANILSSRRHGTGRGGSRPRN